MTFRLIAELKIVDEADRIVAENGVPVDLMEKLHRGIPISGLRSTIELKVFGGDSLRTAGALLTPIEQARQKLNNVHTILRELSLMMQNKPAKN